MKVGGFCNICSLPANLTCRICGRVVCDRCMDGLAGICNDCRDGKTVAKTADG